MPRARSRPCTALTASLSSVACRHSGGMAPSDRAPSRPPSIAATRSGVRRHDGSPSDHCRAEFGEQGHRIVVERDVGRRLVVAGPARGRQDVGGLFEGGGSAGNQAGELLEGLVGAAGDGVGALAAEGVVDDEQRQAAGAERAQLTDGESLERRGRDESGGRAGLGQPRWRRGDSTTCTTLSRRSRRRRRRRACPSRRSARAAPAWRRWPCGGGRWSSRRAAPASSSPIPPVSRSKFDLVLSRKPIVRPVQSWGSGGTATDSVVRTPTGLRTRMRAMRVFLL